MKYIVSRTSSTDHFPGPQPCAGAVLEKVVTIDQRTIKIEEEIDRFNVNRKWRDPPGDNYGVYTDHREFFDYGINDIGVYRKFYEELWVVEIPDLCKFVLEHGRIILKEFNDDMYEVEIYDSYRE